ncbi:MAG: ring-cleaving dioxygenase [Verrucomicrobiota bacterium]|nr:ring-cleaving dioxygenase [Verrucomicrobiota bacterium]
MNTVRGLHHVTAIAGPAQENLDFYVGVLGMRLVKKSVNQDDPGTYHLFYADAEGHPGTDLTFFPWAQMAPSRDGYGLSTEVSLAVPPGSLVFWSGRLQRYGVKTGAAETRFGQRALSIVDPHGLRVALVESEDSLGRPFTAWEESPVEVKHQIRGLESARLTEKDLALTQTFLTEQMGFSHVGVEGEWHRFAIEGGGSGKYVDVRETPAAQRGAWGTGSIHHLAWRVDDEAHQLAVRERISDAVGRVTPVIDRFWFKSVYFPEPGGVLFELATDGPGFAVDEDPTHLGETLVLPPWLEGQRAEIEKAVPKLTPAKV